jgi:hypothetical protein
VVTRDSPEPVVQSPRTDADSLEKLELKWHKPREDLPKIEIL